jgi:hypothetical protein
MLGTRVQRKKKVTSRDRIVVPGLADELAVHELHLSTCSALRLAGLIAGPLLVALAVDSSWITALCWVALALLYYPLLRGWGYTALAMMLGIVPAYAYFELGAPPNWLAFVAAFTGFTSVVYVVERLHSIKACREYMANNEEASESDESHQPPCRSRGVRP